MRKKKKIVLGLPLVIGTPAFAQGTENALRAYFEFVFLIAWVVFINVAVTLLFLIKRKMYLRIISGLLGIGLFCLSLSEANEHDLFSVILLLVGDIFNFSFKIPDLPYLLVLSLIQLLLVIFLKKKVAKKNELTEGA